ncbi:MAG: hypothetical protein NZM12_10390, partial [Steroidobacteraceae bacterium]|nr:hypothetical protein [Steroidobacteraceae bacterium]MDW8260786.1 hypothetical protein [Gammaproteobacteria bacterium]
MNSRRTATVAAVVTFCAAQASFGDDTEVLVRSGAAAGLRPNVLLIIDTSGSMNAEVTLPKPPYDPNTQYAGACDSGQFYFSIAASGTGGGNVPDCSNGIRVQQNTCAAAVAGLAQAGFWSGKAAQWNDAVDAWRELGTSTDRPVECEADAGVHGQTASSNRRYARNGNRNSRWTSDPTRQISWAAASVYTLYSANYLNWYYSSGATTTA